MVFVALSAGGLFSACTVDPFNPVQQIPTAAYRGTFSLTRSDTNDRNARGIGFDEIDIAILINDASRTYKIISLQDSSTVPNSEGSYTLVLRTMTFRDNSKRVFPDTSFVLQGDFIYTFDGQNLVLPKMTRNVNDGV
jgi:hypothetical protein